MRVEGRHRAGPGAGTSAGVDVGARWGGMSARRGGEGLCGVDAGSSLGARPS